LSKKTRKYSFAAEKELTSIFEDILKQCIKEGSVAITGKKAKLVAHNIMVTGQMWAFRRWALSENYSINTYIKSQTELILNGIL
ncbi:MAG: TetR/AcrR family transcriptional regulator, partial [Candidatus Dadabacteria bacterium]|nr:TetR/AcrR family transcriptional regulator [Candidatus Dadabacteria bacterium]NIS10054.1 TetR/AcrR family transcriptional regulator [Candidatus Dadabacteria bacterium]NIV42131.1 TetR/AcrR family transcriptional regulator [Candidatus Dadabacteria bacterium]NIX16440.1 TetR/AcrR family transcriptional regulator [Candidatus Dadabacteria bacterium]NIY23001.1 TetR/AcrR family transcriptional regulator [Candidatus Dadabacteria bacterium]